MPIVTIQVTREGISPMTTFGTSEQKAALIKGASQLVLQRSQQAARLDFRVIEEIELDNWGWGGLPVAELRKKLANSAPGKS
ncbi:4-oxalocrotonate tautomerase [Bradyrhizobium nanningense]|uniref:4-oxalocrotonate tautomerase n=1 Tax=Bradyrhizobium nanningense TaxID=1325118 RepID=A0A4Q0SH18_9BRAD|nr:tautomerase family protein [Bradyrhizobium nanningense]RXH23995.1 4-oxalocrotonate tautomerase [Bradyrhizobium nanningense]RXH38462.1 4-oxalocrotonate tautomerase [Bradyrhizobium nanningense]